MKPLKLRTKLYLVFSLLCAFILLSWGVFYAHTARELNTTSRNYITQVSDRVIDTLESTVLMLEHVAVTLSSSSEVKQFLCADTPMLYHERAQAVSEVLNTVYQPDGLVDDILIYTGDGVYRRFRGNIGNTAADRIRFLLKPEQMPQHIVTTLEGAAYIGYITDVYDGDKPLGYLVFLMQDERLRRLFASYDSSQTLRIGLSANGVMVAADSAEWVGKPPEQMFEGSVVMSSRKVGLTPFELHVADDGKALAASRNTFLSATLATFLLMLGMTMLFYRFLNRLFFSPMLQIVDNAQQIGQRLGQESLRTTGQPEFDSLVAQINSMIVRLEENSHALYAMQYKMQAAEIEKKRTVIISLKKQINAHFTVNTLNVIKRLSEIGESEKAGEMCDDLASLLRYANGAEEFIGGLEEMFVLEKYVDIMRTRYPGRFLAHFDVDDEMDEMCLPRMLVQPIVENAVVHGLAFATKGRLEVAAHVEEEDECLIVRVRDDGCGMSAAQLSLLREKLANAPQTPWNESGIVRIALPNVQKRVVAMFGEGYGLTVESAPNRGTEVTLRLPALRTAQLEAGAI